jgi:hypothetical protein
MTRISSSLTSWHKTIFPAVWFGILALVLSVVLLTGAFLENPIFVVLPIAMGAFGYVLMRAIIWDLVDEVYDCGDHLVVRNGGEEDTVALSNILDVKASIFTRPDRITLRLAHPGKFGAKIVFCPPFKWTLSPFANSLAEDLMIRADEAKRR